MQISAASIIPGTTPVSEAISPQLIRPFHEELLLSKRYWEKSFAYAEVPASNSGTGPYSAPAIATGTAAQRLPAVRFNIKKRAAPTMTIYNPSASGNQVRNLTNSGTCSSTAATVNGEDNFYVDCNGAAGTAVGDRLAFHWVADARL
jgi:hypothetical protein